MSVFQPAAHDQLVARSCRNAGWELGCLLSSQPSEAVVAGFFELRFLTHAELNTPLWFHGASCVQAHAFFSAIPFSPVVMSKMLGFFFGSGPGLR